MAKFCLHRHEDKALHSAPGQLLMNVSVISACVLGFIIPGGAIFETEDSQLEDGLKTGLFPAGDRQLRVFMSLLLHVSHAALTYAFRYVPMHHIRYTCPEQTLLSSAASPYTNFSPPTPQLSTWGVFSPSSAQLLISKLHLVCQDAVQTSPSL